MPASFELSYAAQLNFVLKISSKYRNQKPTVEAKRGHRKMAGRESFYQPS